MDKPVELKKYKRAKVRAQGKGSTLCRRGFHKWKFDDKKQFDVKRGQLVSIKRCERCNAQRTVVG